MLSAAWNFIYNVSTGWYYCSLWKNLFIKVSCILGKQWITDEWWWCSGSQGQMQVRLVTIPGIQLKYFFSKRIFSITIPWSNPFNSSYIPDWFDILNIYIYIYQMFFNHLINKGLVLQVLWIAIKLVLSQDSLQ